MNKRELLDDIRQSTNYLDHLDTPIPPPPAVPGNVDVALKNIGQLAEYMTSIFSAFQGLPLLRIPYHMAQGNEAVLGLLLASLEEEQKEHSGTLSPLFPSEGETYHCEEDMFVLCAWEGDPALVESIGAEFQEDYYNLTPSEIDPSRYGAKIPIVIPEGVESWSETILFFVTCTDEKPVDSISRSFTLTTSDEYNPDAPEFTGGGGGLSGGGGASGSW